MLTAQQPVQDSDPGQRVAANKAANTSTTVSDVSRSVQISPNNTGLPVNLPAMVSNAGCGTSSGTTCDMAITPTQGNSLVVLCGVNNTGTLSASDTGALDTWNTAKSQTGTVAGALIAFANNVSGSATTVRCTAGTSGVVMGTVYQVSGLIQAVSTGGQPDVTDSNTGSSQTAAALSAGIVTDGPNEIVFAAPVLTTNTVCTAVSPWTLDLQQGAVGGRLCPMRLLLGDTDKVTGNVVTFGSASYAMAVASFRPPLLGMEGTVQLYDGTTKVGVIAATNALKNDVSSIAGTATVTASPGIQKVGLAGNAGATLDAANNAALPANALTVGFETATQTTTQPTASTAGNMRFGLARTDGTLYVAPHGPVIWSCGLNAIAATLTQCQAAPAAGLRLYITDVISQSNTSAAGLFTLRFGTGTNCGTGTGNLIFNSASALMASPANTVAVNHFHLTVPIAVTAANAVCVLGVATNTTNIEINGYTAP